MNRIMAISWKEWRVAMDTPLGYVVAVAFLLAAGFFFGNHLFLVGQAEMRGYFSVMPLLLMFFIPAMTMRMLSDEQRSGTFELLATMPIRTIDIVLGKFVAVMLQVSVLLALTLFYPATLALIGNLDGGQLVAGYLALWLLAAAYVTISLYASALTDHAVVAYVIGFGMLFGLFITTQAMVTFSPASQDFITALSPITHYQLMLRGVIGLNDIGLFISTTALFLALTWFQLERRRWR
ncbi:MAG TPA: ABC transporter permease subunit [Mariprofundaceae bacterium]|nr:ABC transporter permease subunit [Mariprofundaceae bacterium]